MARFGIGITTTPSSPNSPVATFVSLYCALNSKGLLSSLVYILSDA